MNSLELNLFELVEARDVNIFTFSVKISDFGIIISKYIRYVLRLLNLSIYESLDHLILYRIYLKNVFIHVRLSVI